MTERLDAIKSELTTVYQDIVADVKEREYKGDMGASVHDFSIQQLAKIIGDLDKVIPHFKKKQN